MEPRRVLIFTFPIQGNINPALQFSLRLINIGIDVTFTTTVNARRRMVKATESTEIPKGLSFVEFSDGNDDGLNPVVDLKIYMTMFRNLAEKSLKEIIQAARENGRPFSCLIYTPLLHWAVEVARGEGIAATLLWPQPATVLNVYYYYFNHGYEDIVGSNDNEALIKFPGISLNFAKQDLPSFMLPSGAESSFVLPLVKEQFETLDAEITKPKILVNSFDALESDALKSIENYELIGIGPMIGSDSKNSFSGDLFRKSDDYIEWLNGKPSSSVVYVAFGSIVKLQKPQLEEIARGLTDCGKPFLWVIRPNECEEHDNHLSLMADLERLDGRIIPWCSQMKVLRHPSVGCFVTHCGWNSTLESLCCGVPMVAFPQLSDQATNAKMVADAWKTGVRVRVGEDGVVKSDEIRLCIEKVMDEDDKSGKLFRENAEKWKLLAEEAMEEDSSGKRLRECFNGI